MSAHSSGIEKARSIVASLWDELAGVASFARPWWPWRNSPGHVAAAQFRLEVERALRASIEIGGRA